MFEFYIMQSEKAERKALDYWKNNDFSMTRFYKNVSKGYKEKAMKLELFRV